MALPREKFSSQASPELLAAVREIARQEGRHFQAVLEDALREYIENRAQAKPAPQSWPISRPASKETAAWVKCWPNDP